MPAEEEVCRYQVKGWDERLAELLAEHVGPAVEATLKDLIVVEVVHGSGSELLLVPRWAVPILRENCAFVYTAGLHAASIRRGRLYPTLSLGTLIEHAIVRCYVVLPEGLVAKLTYGKSIVVDAAGLEAALGECRRVAVLAADSRRFVAWARVEEKGDKLLIKPVVDVGWYLRSGV